MTSHRIDLELLDVSVSCFFWKHSLVSAAAGVTVVIEEIVAVVVVVLIVVVVSTGAELMKNRKRVNLFLRGTFNVVIVVIVIVRIIKASPVADCRISPRVWRMVPGRQGIIVIVVVVVVVIIVVVIVVVFGADRGTLKIGEVKGWNTGTKSQC